MSIYRDDAAWGTWRGVPADLLPAAYAESVLAAGGLPVLLPPVLDSSSAVATLDRLDGVIISGGEDVDPCSYHADPGPHTSGFRPGRDASELALLAAAERRDIPTLGICRGMQVMAVYARGSLDQHLPDTVCHERHSPGPGRYGTIEVVTVAGSMTAGVLGERVTVPCHHHQGVLDPSYLTVSAHSADGVIEALEDPARRFWLGVQWHPETGTDMRLFIALVEAARRVARTGPVTRPNSANSWSRVSADPTEHSR